MVKTGPAGECPGCPGRVQPVRPDHRHRVGLPAPGRADDQDALLHAGAPATGAVQAGRPRVSGRPAATGAGRRTARTATPRTRRAATSKHLFLLACTVLFWASTPPWWSTPITPPRRIHPGRASRRARPRPTLFRPGPEEPSWGNPANQYQDVLRGTDMLPPTRSAGRRRRRCRPNAAGFVGC